MALLAALPAHWLRPIFQSGFYQSWLAAGATGLSAHMPSDPWPGRADAAAPLLDNPISPAEWPENSPLHQFAFLRDLRAEGSLAAKQQAQLLVQQWWQSHGRFSPTLWHPDILAQRLAHGLCFADYAPMPLAALWMQARHLAQTYNSASPGLPQLDVVRALIYAGLALRGLEYCTHLGLQLLPHALNQLLLPDGAPASRNPQDLLLILRHLVEIRLNLRQARLAAPSRLDQAIHQAAPALRSLRHGDGGLALFHGAGSSMATDAVLIDAVLAHAAHSAKTVPQLLLGGWQRLGAGAAVAIIDCGLPPQQGWPHASTLAFEFSLGTERLIVNSGVHPKSAGDYHSSYAQALATTAAHSTICLDDTNAFPLKDNNLHEPPLPPIVTRSAEAGGQRLDVSHDGYADNFGYRVARSLSLNHEGTCLSGEERLQPLQDVGGAPSLLVAWRWHFAPKIKLSLDTENQRCILAMPDGQIWHWQIVPDHNKEHHQTMLQAQLSLETGLYCSGGTVEANQHLLVSLRHTAQQPCLWRWQLLRIS